MKKSIVNISVNDEFISTFSLNVFPQEMRNGMLLSDRIDALNFRLRESEAGYSTDFHVAGDPTLIIVQQGVIRISLQNGNYKDFSAGEMFIAKDYLPEHITFDKTVHGHRAAVISEQTFKAVHIKLNSL